MLGRGETEIYEKLDFQKATAARYRNVIAEYERMNTGMKIVRLDASQSVEKIAEIITKELDFLRR